jgi:hypothetical protein
VYGAERGILQREKEREGERDRFLTMITDKEG